MDPRPNPSELIANEIVHVGRGGTLDALLSVREEEVWLHSQQSEETRRVRPP